MQRRNLVSASAALSWAAWFALFPTPVLSGASDADPARQARLQWFREARFGCFVHWGVYAALGNQWHGRQGGGYAEHVQRVLRIPLADYRRDAVEKFNPTGFDANEWISLVRRAGMRYFIITAKHHDGFAMFDSQASDYNVVKAAPWHHDPMQDLKQACQRQGIRFGFYYSHAFDWGDQYAPGNDWEWQNPGGDRLLGGADWWVRMPEKLADVRKNYVDRKSIPQIRELIARYRPDILWFDTPHKLPYEENLRILEIARAASQNIVINGRLARNSQGNRGDYLSTGDRAVEFVDRAEPWEAIPTTNESYAWNPFDNSHKTAQFLIRVLAKAVSRGGNLLLNIGPMGDGRIDPKDVAILEGIGRWMEANEPAIRGCGRAPLPVQPWGVVTARATTLYLHVFDWRGSSLVVGGLRSTPVRAWLLADSRKSSLRFRRLNAQDLSVALPASAPDPADSVIALEFDREPQGGGPRLLTYAAGGMNQLLAFDAERRHGDATGEAAGFGYGDGKADRYYVTGWTDTRQSLHWECRLNSPARFNVALKYARGSGTGSYAVRCGAWKVVRAVRPPTLSNGSYLDSLGTISLPAGSHRIDLLAQEIQKGEIFRPLELQLQPVGQ